MSHDEVWEEEDWFPEEAKTPVKQIPAILDPKHHAALANIVNQLYPSSFVRLSRTCKTMYSLCFHSNDVMHSVNNLHVYIQNHGDKYSMHFENADGGAMTFLDSPMNRRLIRENYPFVFNFDKLTVMRTLDEEIISTLLSFLKELPVKKITEISTDLPEDWLPWNGFLQILQDYNVEVVNIHRFDGGYDTFPDDMARQLLKSNLKKFCCEFCMPDELIFEATIPHWDLTGTKISLDSFRTLLLKCAGSTDDISWGFGAQFALHHRFLFNTIPFDHKDPIPADRPLVVLGEKYKRDFWILRNEGKVVHCFNDDDLIRLSTYEDPDTLPPCIRSMDLADRRGGLLFVPTREIPQPYREP